MPIRLIPLTNLDGPYALNYQNDHDCTRIDELRQVTGRAHPGPSIVYECLQAEGDPRRPVSTPQNAAPYKSDPAEADVLGTGTFFGRLATCRHFAGDQLVGQALTAFKRLRERPRALHGACAPIVA